VTNPWLNENKSVKLVKPTSKHSVYYQCLPSTMADTLSTEYPDTVAIANFLCPTNPNAEPLIRNNLFGTTYSGVPTNLVNLSVAESIHSTTHDRVLIDFPTNWTVDRTSRWGAAGQLLESSVGWNLTNYIFVAKNSPWGGIVDCSLMNDPMAMLKDLGSRPSNNGITLPISLDFLEYSCLSGQQPFWAERENYCLRKSLNQYASTRCPQYGRAISGICQSAMINWAYSCQSANIADQTNDIFTGQITSSAYGPASIYPPNYITMGSLMGYRVVADSTPWCLQEMPLTITGEFEALAGTYAPLSQQNNAASTTVCFDCCD